MSAEIRFETVHPGEVDEASSADELRAARKERAAVLRRLQKELKESAGTGEADSARRRAELEAEIRTVRQELHELRRALQEETTPAAPAEADPSAQGADREPDGAEPDQDPGQSGSVQDRGDARSAGELRAAEKATDKRLRRLQKELKEEFAGNAARTGPDSLRRRVELEAEIQVARRERREARRALRDKQASTLRQVSESGEKEGGEDQSSPDARLGFLRSRRERRSLDAQTRELEDARARILEAERRARETDGWLRNQLAAELAAWRASAERELREEAKRLEARIRSEANRRLDLETARLQNEVGARLRAAEKELRSAEVQTLQGELARAGREAVDRTVAESAASVSDAARKQLDRELKTLRKTARSQLEQVEARLENVAKSTAAAGEATERRMARLDEGLRELGGSTATAAEATQSRLTELEAALAETANAAADANEKSSQIASAVEERIERATGSIANELSAQLSAQREQLEAILIRVTDLEGALEAAATSLSDAAIVARTLAGRGGRLRDEAEAADLNLNSATFERLRELGLSITQATRVLARREALGGFSSLSELDELPGFPPGMLAELEKRASV